MSHDMDRKGYYHSRDPRNRDPRNREHDWSRGSDLGRGDYRARLPPRRSRSPPRHGDKRRSRSPKKEKDLDENILSEISKLPDPSELWDSQFQDSGYGGPPQPSLAPPAFPSEPLPSPYGSNYQSSYSGIYSDFPSVPAPPPPEIAQWNQMSLPPPPTSNAPTLVNQEDQIKKEAAIESEMRQQKAALSKQREDYIKKAGVLKKELDTLRDQRTELRGDSKRSPSPDTKRFLKENTKLQLEIQNKLKTINNVVDMLNGIIGEEAQLPLDAEDSDDPDRPSKRKSRSPPSSSRKFNYVYYDPEMHWCRVCCEFPPTAKDYLNHLHSAAHQKMAAAHMEAPWHSMTGVNEGFPSYPSAPTKRTPIRGLQFFVPSTAWYCKLCDQFIGDLHCASAHLKSITHSNNYTNFVEQNPHWETDWMSDRQKAFEKSRGNKKPTPDVKASQYSAHTITFNKDGVATAKNKKTSPPPAPAVEAKKKKRVKKKKKAESSSSSSDSDSSDSEPVRKKKKKEKLHLPSDEKALAEWMSAVQTDRLKDSDRKLLDTLRARMKLEREKEKRSPPVRVKRDRSDSPPRRREPEHHRREPRDRELPRDTQDRDPRDRDLSRDGREREREARDRERERDRGRRRSPPPPRDDAKPPVHRKMPFIGKMPVYKSLTKSKQEELKKEEEKKKEEDEAAKKRREEMDAEIQKKVAEFKEKIAKAQLERSAATMELTLPPPAIALPTALGVAPPPALLPGPPPQPATAVAVNVTPAAAKPGAPALPKDFQEALDIIFPSGEVKAELQTADMFSLPPGFPMSLGGVMPSFPPFLQPPMMMGAPFDMFQQQQQQPTGQQLYDNHVPLVPNTNKPRANNPRNPAKKGYQGKNPNPNHNKNKNNKNHNQNQNSNASKDNRSKENGEDARKKEELDDLAMLGIDASDVGSGM